MASFGHPTLMVVGAGFLGREVVRGAHAGGWEVIPVVRSPGSVAVLREEFPQSLAADALEPTFWESLPTGIAGLVWAAAPSRAFPTDNFEVMQSRGAVAAAKWAGRQGIPFVYISSTSVYAENDGGWVDEDAPVATEDSRSRAIVKAEEACLRAKGTVLRCAGLYGKERVLKPDGEGPERWLNLIHVEDAARAVGMALRQRGKIFNVCEDEPRRRGRPGGSWSEGSRRARRNKRVRNGRLRSLGWEVVSGLGR